MTCIEEAEGAVLIVGRRCRRGRPLNLVVLTRTFDGESPLHRVAAHHLGHVVVDGVGITRPIAGIRPHVQPAQAGHSQRRKFLRIQLPVRGKEEGITHAVGTALATRPARRVVGDHAISVRRAGYGQFVDEGGSERARKTDNSGTVGTGIELVKPGRAGNPVELIRNVRAAKREGVLVRHPVINSAGVLSLILPGGEG